MRHTPIKRRAGLSLIEVLLAVAVLAFGLAGVAQLFQSSQTQSQRNRKRVLAEMLAEQKAQELKAAGFDALIEYLSKHEQDGARHMALYPLEPVEERLEARGAVGSGLDCLWQAELEQLNAAPRCIRVVSRVRWRQLRAPDLEAVERVYVFE